MSMNNVPRPGIWGDEARPGEIIRIRPDGVKVYNLGAWFLPVTGENHKKRRAYRLE